MFQPEAEPEPVRKSGKTNVVVFVDPEEGGSRADEADSVYQAQSVLASLLRLGMEARIRPFRRGTALEPPPDLVFNLVESERDGSSLALAAPDFFAGLGIPCTGGSSRALRLSTSKVQTKKLLEETGIPTLPWFDPSSGQPFPGEGEYIVKPVDTDASIGLDEDSVFHLASAGEAEEVLEKQSEAFGLRFFAEAYVEGREFNISMLASRGESLILSPAEMLFLNYQGRKTVLGYKAKWDEESFESRNTLRSFRFTEEDDQLLAAMKDISRRCWEAFKLESYVRVDFRCDPSGRPRVLEINQNPCISPDSGFAAAAAESGISYDRLIEIIALEAMERKRRNET
jgi:D-alanine-D-alanine ligase